MLAPADAPLVLDKSVLNRVLNSVTYSEHSVIQISHRTKIARQNTSAVEEEGVVGDAEAYVEGTFSEGSFESFLVRCYRLAARILQPENLLKLVTSATSLLAYVGIVLFENRAICR